MSSTVYPELIYEGIPHKQNLVYGIAAGKVGRDCANIRTGIHQLSRILAPIANRTVWAFAIDVQLGLARTYLKVGMRFTAGIVTITTNPLSLRERDGVRGVIH
jgi:hypothetical protein